MNERFIAAFFRSCSAIAQEKQEQSFRKSIEGFPKDSLRHSHTQEKNVLPDATQINKEKTLQGISAFDKEKLKLVGTSLCPLKSPQFLYTTFRFE